MFAEKWKHENAIITIILAGLIFSVCDGKITDLDQKTDNQTPQCIVYFDTDGGSDPPNPITVNAGTSLGPSFPPNPSNRLFKFGGWFRGKEGTGSAFNADTVVIWDITVYACWLYYDEDELPLVPNRQLIDIEIVQPAGDILMGNFMGEMLDYSNFEIRNVYDDGLKAATRNYTASISGSNNTFTAGQLVTVNFTSKINHDITASITRPVSKTLANTGLPVIYVNTINTQTINSRDTYVKTNIKIVSHDPPFNLESVNYQHEIRGRGNSTWSYPKKPFRIRFAERTSLFGLADARNWVLLANYKDYTLLTSTAAFEMARRLKLPFTNNAVHVDLVLNDNYYGSFVLTEHIQVNRGRVYIDEADGYLVEFDTYQDDGFRFTTGTSSISWAYVKSPDLGNSHVPGYQFVMDSVNEFDYLLNSGSTLSSVNYNALLDIADINSFVNYLMVYEITRNLELQHPKSTYMHKDADKKITMGPVWDFDWAFGLEGDKSINLSRALGRYTVNNNKFGRFHTNQNFTALYKTRWNEKYSEIISMPDFIDEMYQKIRVSESLDAIRWHGSVNYANEIDKIKSFWTTRASWLNSEINK